jgi:cyanophycinase
VISAPLFVVGGGETPAAAVDAFLDAAGREGPIIVVGQVREEPARAQASVEWLQERGAKSVILWSAESPDDEDRRQAASDLARAKGIYIPGGDQNLVLDRWGTDWIRSAFGDAHRRGLTFFGTSAGAMLMSDRMIAGYGPEHFIAETRIGIGLTTLIIDTHYAERNRQGRLAYAEARFRMKGLGLNESQWSVIEGGRVWTPQEWGRMARPDASQARAES